uniref:Uncharacterized protein n=1 Tax=Arundo donax TaxID=35708 RepID=A0A0A9F6D7_ARUDO
MYSLQMKKCNSIYCNTVQLFIYLQSTSNFHPFSFGSFIMFTGPEEKDTISTGAQKEEVFEIIANQLSCVFRLL